MSPSSKQIPLAIDILRRGGLVAFPTETVYGLGADATNPSAVERVFTAKGRPNTNPLIVHVSDSRVAQRYARCWPEQAEALARRFWPGPLTLVLPKSTSIVMQVSAGRDTVGLRAPDHPLALELLRQFDGPVAAPSANRSNCVSPTTAEHVRRQLGSAVDLVLDGGQCRVGIESTVVDLAGDPPTILRLGSIPRDQIEQIIGPVQLFTGSAAPSHAANSPGQQPVHYAPAAPAFRFEGFETSRAVAWCREHPLEPTAILALDDSSALRELIAWAGKLPGLRGMPADPAGYARQLYAALHDADAGGAKAILIELPPDEMRWAAVRDRLIRATRPL